MGLTDKNNNAIQHGHQPGERPAYSITLEDLGAQVQWTVESDLTTVAEGSVPIDTWEGRSLPARLSRAFDRAYATSEVKRAELLNRDLEAARHLAAAQEQQDTDR